MKNQVLNIIIILSTISMLCAHCGSCDVIDKPEEINRSSIFLTSIPEDGKIDGFLLAACGMCKFEDKNSRGCRLNIKIEDKVYSVVSKKISDFGDMHAADGMCNVIRLAYTSGNIKDNKFYPDTFILVDSNKID